MEVQPELELPVENDLDPEFLPTAEDCDSNDQPFENEILGEVTSECMQTTQLSHPSGIVGFATYHDLQRHNKFAHPPVCTHCGKKCRSNKDLTAHMDIMHPPPGTNLDGLPQRDKRFLCPFQGCARSLPGNGFSKKGNMDVHIKSAHLKEKSFVCGKFDLAGNKKVEGWNGHGCGMAMQTKQALIGHIRTQHIGVPALDARSGLKYRERTRPIQPKQVKPDSDDDAMDLESTEASAVAKKKSKMIAMMTGSGYEEFRPLACLTANDEPAGCQMRFTNDYELASHLELTHGWNVDDINDALEANANASHGPAAATTGWDDAVFRQQLEMQLGSCDGGDLLDPELCGPIA